MGHIQRAPRHIKEWGAGRGRVGCVLALLSIMACNNKIVLARKS